MDKHGYNTTMKGREYMKRTKLAMRTLPNYTKGEEIMNMVTHITGGGLGVIIMTLCIFRSVNSTAALTVSLIYGISMIALYTMSSVYHGLHPGTAKKVMQVLDHCSIYFLIAGTYTPILLIGFVPVYPVIGWGLFAAEWTLCIVAAALTAIDLKIYNTFSMICYITMGWGIIFFITQCMRIMTPQGFYLLLSGGITYTVGAVLYGIGNRVPWMHSVFHIFVVLGSLLQFFAIFFYVL